VAIVERWSTLDLAPTSPRRDDGTAMIGRVRGSLPTVTGSIRLRRRRYKRVRLSYNMTFRHENGHESHVDNCME
jgi:hypothetical protein